MPEAQQCRACLTPTLSLPMGEKNGYGFIACTQCGSVFTTPTVTQKDIDALIADIQPEAVHDPRADAEIEYLNKLLSRIGGEGFTGKSFLDVSCNRGYAVKAARLAGFKDVHGIEQYEFLIRFAKKNYGDEYFSQISATDYAAAGHQADIIFCKEAFSIHPDTEELAAALAKLLSPNGRIYIDEPDGNSFWLPHKFARWPFLEPPLNSVYLSLKGMKKVLTRHGLKVERKFFNMKPFMRLLVRKS
ncbi:MAG: methyltransferase domain-containing protein [Alphaproteobacteria bacterium]|nr:methyltransferase domain-containing protein [Alphaproteobacteria bacterium]